MKKPNFSHNPRRLGFGAVLLSFGLQLIFVAFPASCARAQEGFPAGGVFDWVNLQGDLAGTAGRTDPNLIAPWGVALNPYTNVFWVADNGTGVSTFYHADGTPVPLISNGVSPLLTVTIPQTRMDSGTSPWPTGVVFNPSANAFLI